MTDAAWFDSACTQSLAPGIQVVSVQSRPDDQGRDGRILIGDDGTVWVPASRYADWTGRSPASDSTTRSLHNESWLALTGIAHRLDACDARLQIAAELPGQHWQRDAESRLQVLPAIWAGTLNLGLTASANTETASRLATDAELGVSSPWGYARSRHLFLPEGTVRLDSQWRRDLTGRRETLLIGDQVSTDLQGNRLLSGGLSWGSDFSQHPELPTFPLPSIAGTSLLPSMAEIYVDNQLRQRVPLQAGDFLLSPELGSSGYGELSVVTRDRLGREVRISEPFYSSPQLLRPGLTDWNLLIGKQRLALGQDNDRYEEGFVRGRWRQGLSDRLTAGLQTDLLEQSQILQSDWLWSSVRLGLSNLQLGLSSDRDAGGGHMAGFSQSWRSQRSSWQAGFQTYSPEHLTLGRDAGAIARRITVNAARDWGHGMQTSIARIDETRRIGEDLTLNNLAIQKSWHSGWQLNLGATHVASQGWQKNLTAYRWISTRQSLSASLRQDSEHALGAELQWQWRPEEDWSLRAGLARSRDQQRTTLSALYDGQRGTGSVISEHSNLSRSLLASLDTTVNWSPGLLGWGRRLQDSWLIVDAGLPGIRVYQDNQAMGETQANGRLLVSRVRPYHPSEIRLEAADIPLSHQISHSEQQVRPPRGAGLVSFALPVSDWSQRWHVRLPDGGALPAGSHVSRDREASELPSGNDGLLWLPQGWVGARIRLQLPDGRQCIIESLPAPADNSATEVTCQFAP